MNFSEERIPLPGSANLSLVFDFNTMAYFEDESKRQATKNNSGIETDGAFYFDFLMEIYRIYEESLNEAKVKARKANPEWEPTEENVNALSLNVLQIMRRVKMTDLRVLVWAALHTYDENDDPDFPLTISAVGRFLNKPLEMPKILNAILRGHSRNSPTEKQVGEVKPAGKVIALDEPAKRVSVNTGTVSTELGEEDFG